MEELIKSKQSETTVEKACPKKQSTPAKNETNQIDRLKEYYQSELAKKDDIIFQQRVVIKQLSQK